MGKTLWLRALIAAIVIFGLTYALSLVWPQIHELLPWSFLASPLAINAKPIFLWLKDNFTEYLLEDFKELKGSVEGLKKELSLVDLENEKLREKLLDLVSAEHKIMMGQLNKFKDEINQVENKVIRVEALMEVTGKYQIVEELSDIQRRIDKLESNG